MIYNKKRLSMNYNTKRFIIKAITSTANLSIKQKKGRRRLKLLTLVGKKAWKIILKVCAAKINVSTFSGFINQQKRVIFISRMTLTTDNFYKIKVDKLKLNDHWPKLGLLYH